MTPPTFQKNQTPFDDEISLSDISQFFIANFKRILFFIILGGILGYLYGKLADPVYDGSILISLPSVNGKLLTDPKTTLTQLDMSTYFTKEAFLACNNKFHEDSVYNKIDIVKKTITQDGKMIKLMMASSNKETIHACLESIARIITEKQKILAGPIIEAKKNELDLFEKKLKLAEVFQDQLNEELIKNLKKIGQQNSKDIFNADLLSNNALVIKLYLDQISKIKIEFLPEQANLGGKVLDVNIERKSFPSAKLSMLLGLFLGSILGFFVSFVRNMKTN